MFHTYYICYFDKEANNWVIDGGEPLFAVSPETAYDILSGAISQRELRKLVEMWDDSFKVGTIVGYSCGSVCLDEIRTKCGNIYQK